MFGWMDKREEERDEQGLFNRTILPTLVTRLVDEESLSARVVKARTLALRWYDVVLLISDWLLSVKPQ